MRILILLFLLSACAAQSPRSGIVKLGMTKAEVVNAIGQPCGYCYGTRKSSHGDSWEYNTFGTGVYGIGRGQYIFFDREGRVVAWEK